MEKLKQIAEWFQSFGITLYQVGGSVRDELMNLPIEDIDVCVVGGHTAQEIAIKLYMLQGMNNITQFTPVHGSFPIWIVEIDGEKYEFAMARKERKVGQTRQEFECEVNNITIEEDLMRRDLTINAIAKNLVTGEIVDPYGGVQDIEYKLAIPVSKAFTEDSLRVYRAARFIAKFELEAGDSLILRCKECDHTKVSNERVGMELYKVFEQAKKPSLFFYFLKDIGWLEYHFPELHALIDVPQSPLHHPEGDAFTHTMHCIDAAQGWFYRAVMMCHDLGKATTTTINNVFYKTAYTYPANFLDNQRINAYGHEEAGVELTKNMLKRIGFSSHDVIDQIACLVELHMIRAVMTDGNWDKIVRRTIRKLMKYNLTYKQLCMVVFYDLCGRPPKEKPDSYRLTMELHGFAAEDLEFSDAMEPIVRGSDLLDLGMEPGKEVGKILKHALELQDRGTLKKDNWHKVLKGAGYKIFQTKTN
jgi:tRNA nucleotidyltransferase (CCA-adding enzyme)